MFNTNPTPSGLLAAQQQQADPKPRRLTYQEIDFWNKYAKANPRATANDIYSQILKQKIKPSFALDDINSELDLMNQNQQRIRQKDRTEANKYAQSQNYFPEMTFKGQASAVNGDLKSRFLTTEGSRRLPTTVPSYVDKLHSDGTNYWYLTKDNDNVDVDKSVLNDPRFKIKDNIIMHQ